LAAVVDLQRLGVVPGAMADLAVDVDVGEEVHLDALGPLALAGLAPAALDVEAEAADLVAAELGLPRRGEDLADLVEDAGVGGGVAARGAADGGLVDLDDFVDLAHAGEGFVVSGFELGTQELALEAGNEGLVDQGGLAGAANSRDADEAAQGETD